MPARFRGKHTYAMMVEMAVKEMQELSSGDKLKRELEELMKRMEGLIQYHGSGADLIREIREETTGKAVRF